MSPKTVRGKGKRHPLNMRTTKELRDRLEAAARASGRSLVQEVEHRLGMSFAEEDWHEQLMAEETARRQAGDLLKEVKDLKARVARMDELLSVKLDFSERTIEEVLKSRRELERRRDEIERAITGRDVEPRREEEVERKIAEAKERQQRLKQP